MDEPVSVLIPTYNRSGLVGRAIASAVAAISAGDEIVVVDDGSTDGTAEVVARQRGAVRYIQAPHRGVSAARNRGLREARNPLVAFLDSDDTWEPDKLTLQRSVMSAFSDVVFCFSTFRLTTKTGAEKGDGLSVWNGKRCDWDTVLGPGVPFSSIGALPPGRPDFCLHLGDLRLPLMEVPLSYIQINTVVVRRTLAGDALHFVEALSLQEDFECFGRLAAMGRAAYMDCETATQHYHAGQRLTDAAEVDWITTRIAALESGWGGDAEFLSRHGVRYERVLAAQHMRHARWLLRSGRTAAARRALRSAGPRPSLLWLLAMMPGVAVRGGVALRRWLKLKLGHPAPNP